MDRRGGQHCEGMCRTQWRPKGVYEVHVDRLESHRASEVDLRGSQAIVPNSCSSTVGRNGEEGELSISTSHMMNTVLST